MNLERLMLDCSPTMMLLVRPPGLQIVIANLTAQRTLGFSEAELQTMTITAIESSLQDVFYWEDVSNGQCQQITSQEGVYQCADGATLTVVKSVTLLEQDGATLLLVMARVVEAERAVEDMLAQTLSQLQATLESTGNGILVIDWQGRIASMNHMFSTMWRLPRELMDARDDEAILDFIGASAHDSDACRALAGNRRVGRNRGSVPVARWSIFQLHVTLAVPRRPDHRARVRL